MQQVPVIRTTNSAGQEEVTVSFRTEESAWSLYNRLLARGRMQYAYWMDETTPAPTEPPDRLQRALDAVPHPDRSLNDDLLGIEYNTARFVPFIDPATGEERKYTEPVPRIRFDLVRHPEVTAICYRAEDLPLFYDLLQMLGIELLAQEGKDNTTSEALTRREIEVACLLSKGLNDKEIAETLVISANTAREHRQKIAKKWGITEHLAPLQNEARRRGYKGG